MRYKWITWPKVAGVLAALWALGCEDQRAGVDADAGRYPDAEDAGHSESLVDGAPAADKLADPGPPEVQFGTKGEARLFVGDREVGYIFFTVLAPDQADLSHVFFLPEPRASVEVADYYVSLVLDRAAWRTGTYSGALAGRASITLANGVEYRSPAIEASVNASITGVTVIAGSVYMSGHLMMVLAAASGGEPMRVEATLNN